LKHRGAAIRTIMATSDVSCFLLSGEHFLKICRPVSPLQGIFRKRIYKKLIRDESYVSIISASQAFQFIRDIPPFSFLPPEVVENLAPRLSMVQYPKDTILFTQGTSTVDCLYILQKGAVERYFEEKNAKTLRGILSEGAMYGGISMLLNDGISVRTLKTNEHSFFYILPRKEFFELCSRYEVFSEFFTDTFGKRMLDRTYAEIVTRKVQRPGMKPCTFSTSRY
jgi:CBS domain-containing protein